MRAVLYPAFASHAKIHRQFQCVAANWYQEFKREEVDFQTVREALADVCLKKKKTRVVIHVEHFRLIVSHNDLIHYHNAGILEKKGLGLGLG